MITIALLQPLLLGFDVMTILFGDILSVSKKECLTLAIGSSIVLIIYACLWRKLVLVSLNEDLSQIECINVATTKYIFMLLLSVVIAFAIKVVGVLLTALLIIPAATARLLSKSPLQMTLLAMVIAIASVIAGLMMSMQWDLPTGPAIVLAATLLFLMGRLGFSKWV
jgi:zinc transport system permease protein